MAFPDDLMLKKEEIMSSNWSLKSIDVSLPSTSDVDILKWEWDLCCYSDRPKVLLRVYKERDSFHRIVFISFTQTCSESGNLVTPDAFFFTLSYFSSVISEAISFSSLPLNFFSSFRSWCRDFTSDRSAPNSASRVSISMLVVICLEKR